MTKKRFTIEIIENDVFIHQEGANHYLGHKDYVNADMVCDLLNELSEENDQLKSDLTHTKVLLNSLQDKYSGLLNLVHGFDGDVE